jgi:hypothetical protein
MGRRRLSLHGSSERRALSPSVAAFSKTLLCDEDLAAVLAMSACDRAGAAIATSITELSEAGLATDRITAVLMKHFLVHFSGLQAEYEQLLGGIEDADLAPTRAYET